MTVYVPQDAARPVKDFLAEDFAGRFPGVRCALALDDEWKPNRPPMLVVAVDGGGLMWPVLSRPTLRLTVWSNSRSRSCEIVAVAVGLLLCSTVPGVAKILPGTDVLDARDSKNHGLMASATVRTRMRTAAI
ncbi:hypothetical protein AB0362_13065 [Rhodococcus sp. NPDC079359]|uniref:hypothetical protein n=1 Tax=Rhodococcus sp. NPDC079359 TaxID=3154961 RepID=UPI00344EF713